jgi:hypothetical protein
LERMMLPCSSVTFWLPARWCKPSTFWVMRTTPGTRASSAASALWPGFGAACFTSSRRQAYHSQTRRGSRANASGVASSCGSYRDQRPVWASRKVGTPLSAEMPEPVRTATPRASCSVVTRLSGMRVGASTAPPPLRPRGPLLAPRVPP